MEQTKICLEYSPDRDSAQRKLRDTNLIVKEIVAICEIVAGK